QDFVEFFFSSRRRHTRSKRDWSSDVCSSDLNGFEWLGHILRCQPFYLILGWTKIYKGTVDMTAEQHQSIAILDFGSQFTQLIARRIREAGVYCEILPGTASVQKIQALPQLKGIILSGRDRKSTRLNSSHVSISSAVFC